MFIFQKTYTRNGLFKGRKNFLVVTASTYVKLQQAYYAEQNLFGGWSMIGYTAPGSGETTNFFYGEAFDHNTTTNNASGIGWAADNKVVLNKCAKEPRLPRKTRAVFRVEIGKLPLLQTQRVAAM